MTYEDLPEELRSKLEETKLCAVRYSSLASERNDKIDDAILLARPATDEESVALHKAWHEKGYQVHHVVRPWFSFISEGKTDEEATRMAKEAAEVYE